MNNEKMNNEKDKEKHRCIANMELHFKKNCPLLKGFKEVV